MAALKISPAGSPGGLIAFRRDIKKHNLSSSARCT
jgi:hypothetical protein